MIFESFCTIILLMKTRYMGIIHQKQYTDPSSLFVINKRIRKSTEEGNLKMVQRLNIPIGVQG